MFIGVTRRIDELGRVTLPKELRNIFRLEKGELVEILGTDSGILIRIPGVQVIKKPVSIPVVKGED